MRAILMVGGQGVRLRPFTTTIPKPLVPVGGEFPILEVLLRQLSHYGVRDVTLATGHLGHLIESYVGDGNHWGLDVDYWQDKTPLGTVGPLVEHLDELPDHFLLMNGDLLCDIDFRDLYDFHRRSSNLVSVAAARRQIRIDFGVLSADGDTLQEFREKPELEYLVNMGIYAISRRSLERFQPGEELGADQLIRDCIEAERASVYRFDGYWLDIGRPEDYDRANAEFAAVRSLLLHESEEVAGPSTPEPGHVDPGHVDPGSDGRDQLGPLPSLGPTA